MTLLLPPNVHGSLTRFLQQDADVSRPRQQLDRQDRHRAPQRSGLSGAPHHTDRRSTDHSEAALSDSIDVPARRIRRLESSSAHPCAHRSSCMSPTIHRSPLRNRRHRRRLERIRRRSRRLFLAGETSLSLRPHCVRSSLRNARVTLVTDLALSTASGLPD
jgi:hypothetical protein